jgi:hypothetical protein
MDYGQGVLSRLSVPGLILLVLGAVVCLWAPKLSALLFPKGGERATLPLKVAGLVVAILGGLILLDVFPML